MKVCARYMYGQQTGQLQVGTHSKQGGGHGHHGPGGLHKQSPNTTTRHNTYKVLKKDPTSQLKNKLISLLKDIKQTGGLSTNKY